MRSKNTKRVRGYDSRAFQATESQNTGGGKNLEYLNLLVQSGIALGEIADTEELFENMTGVGLMMGQCEGCSIYSVEGTNLRFHTTRNRVIEQRESFVAMKSFLLPINAQTIAGYCALEKKTVNIPDVYRIPQDLPFTFNPTFDKWMNYRSQSMIAIPMCDSKGTVLGVLQLINHVPGNGAVVPFPCELESYLRALGSQVGIVLKNALQAAELKRSRIETVRRFVKASEYHDKDTGGHIERMSQYSAMLYDKLGYSSDAVERIGLASMLHDVGKIAIPDAILKKPGPLTPEEREVMNLHTIRGYEMLSDAESPLLQMGAVIAITHHEKWNGMGYPRKLSGADIAIEGRIVALADVFDALCSKRCYKEAWTLDRVLETIKADAGTHFDPGLVEIFIANLDTVLKIRDKFSQSAKTEEVPQAS